MASLILLLSMIGSIVITLKSNPSSESSQGNYNLNKSVKRSLNSSPQSSFSLMGPLNKSHLKATKAKGVYIIVEDGTTYLDGCAGAAVSSIGHGNKRVIEAMVNQNKTGITYLSSS